jgi:L-2-hydroxyglutarate oxidase LhgO
MDADVVVVGAGAVGSSTARHLARRGHDVTVVEKEPGPALHQSGRNSGVVHSGIHLKPGSTKARFCVEGSKRLRAYCRENGIPLQVGGKLVVAQDEEDVETLEELDRRARENGVEARLVDGDEIPEIEAEAQGIEALHAPEGGSVDARAYTHELASEAVNAGATFLFDTAADGIRDPSLGEALEEHDLDASAPSGGGADPGVAVETSKGPLKARVAVNCAGLQADRLAGPLAHDVRVVPFRGYYAELKPNRRHLVRSHVYPAPDLSFPFLGIHLSRRTDGRVIVGPGAMLAFGREAYRFRGVNLRDMISTLSWPGFYRLFKQPKFRGLVRSEIRKSLQLSAIRREAQDLCPAVDPGDLAPSYAGNRAQLVDRAGNLVRDIRVRSTDRAVHVLNAVSPGLTCSLPFGEALADRVEDRL